MYYISVELFASFFTRPFHPTHYHRAEFTDGECIYVVDESSVTALSPADLDVIDVSLVAILCKWIVVEILYTTRHPLL